jgi:hypothetical protein
MTFGDPIADISKASSYALDLDIKSREAMRAISHGVRVKNKQNGQLGLAGIISENEAAEVRKILGVPEVRAGDVMLLLDDSTPFFINKTLFEQLYEVLAS